MNVLVDRQHIKVHSVITPTLFLNSKQGIKNTAVQKIKNELIK